MSQILIPANPKEERQCSDADQLSVSEFFYDTIQGEGPSMGLPAAFLRLQFCTLDCHWCDTQEVWKYGNPYSFTELLDMIEDAGLHTKLKNPSYRLVITGGSPLKQMSALLRFFQTFAYRFHFEPFIEVENECTIMPTEEFNSWVHLWNNSPKLSNSGNPKALRYHPDILQFFNSQNACFKFVIMGEADWQEIKQDFIDRLGIERSKIVLMPEGGTRNELARFREKVVDIAIREGVRYTTREQIVLWDKATGV